MSVRGRNVSDDENEVELKIDPRDGQAKVIEVNPRFGAYVGFAVRCGVALPHLAAMTALGQLSGPGDFPYEIGRRFVHPAGYMKALRDELRDGQPVTSVAREAWRELRGGFMRNSSDLTDPMPGLGVALRRARKALTGQLHF